MARNAARREVGAFFGLALLLSWGRSLTPVFAAIAALLALAAAPSWRHPAAATEAQQAP